MSDQPVADSEASAPKPMVRPRFLLILLLVFVVVPGACLASLSYCVGGPGRAIGRAHASLRPGLTIRETLDIVDNLGASVFVSIQQDAPDGTALVQWFSRRQGSSPIPPEATVEAVAARVRPGLPLKVHIAPLGSRQDFTIELDGERRIVSVSPIVGHAD